MLAAVSPLSPPLPFSGLSPAKIVTKDIPVPRGLFDLLADSVFGAKGKRPHLMVRSWLTALLRLSLLQGSTADGVFQHDIVRDYAKSRQLTDIEVLQEGMKEKSVEFRRAGELYVNEPE